MPTAFISVPTYAPPSIESPTEIAAFTPTVTALSDISATRMVFSTPTQEIYPSITPVKVIQINTPIPNIQPQNPPQQNPPSQNSSSQSTNNCSSQLAYAKSVHQYNLARINQIYQPLIDFYQSMINQAVAERDAIGLNDYKRKLDSQKNQLNNAIKAENQRYQGEISYINSTCK
jgi:hypothetical protein